MPTIHANGIDLYVEERGSGDPVLLIMGMNSTIRLWDLTYPALAERFRAVRYDQRGAGQSERAPGPYSIAGLTQDAVGVLDALGIERAHVVGWSMGGMVAQELAIRHPERVDRLALIATFARAREPLVQWWVEFGHWARVRNPERRSFALWNVPWSYSPAFFRNPQGVVDAIEAAMTEPDPVPPEIYLAQGNACIETDTLDRLASIRSETLVLVGAEDILTPVYYAEEIAARVPRAALHVLPHGGHASPIEFAAEVNDLLLSFLGG